MSNVSPYLTHGNRQESFALMTSEYDSVYVGGGLQANAAVQSPQLHPVVQSAEVPHRNLSGQLDSKEKRVPRFSQ